MTDTSVADDANYYWLEDIDWSMNSTLHGLLVVSLSGQPVAIATVEQPGMYRIPYDTLAAVGLAMDGSRIQVFVNGQEVGAYVSNEQGPMRPGDSVVVFVATEDASVEISDTDSPSRMDNVDAGPHVDGGSLYTAVASEAGSAIFFVENAYDR